MDRSRCRKFGAAWAVAQGLLTALVPQLSVKMLKKMLGTNFENAAELAAKPAYLRQLRALGIGLAAAGVANLVMDRVAESEAGETDGDGPAVDAASD